MYTYLVVVRHGVLRGIAKMMWSHGRCMSRWDAFPRHRRGGARQGAVVSVVAVVAAFRRCAVVVVVAATSSMLVATTPVHTTTTVDGCHPTGRFPDHVHVWFQGVSDLATQNHR